MLAPKIPVISWAPFWQNSQAGRIGTIDEPKEYFAGAMSMRWGSCIFPFVPQLTPSPLVYFGGTTETTVVGLGGSAKHVIGEVGSARTGVHSCLPAFNLNYGRNWARL